MEVVCLIPVHEAEKREVLRAWESAIPHFDDVIIGDASGHDWLSDVSKRPFALRHAKVVPLSNRSIGANRNELVEAAPRGSWCMFLDHDDAYLPTLSAFLQLVELRRTVGLEVFVGDTLNVDALGRTPSSDDSFSALWSMPDGDEWAGWPLEVRHGYGWCPVAPAGMLAARWVHLGAVLFQRDHWRMMQGCQDRTFTGEDHDAVARLAFTGLMQALLLPIHMYTMPNGRRCATTRIERKEEDGDFNDADYLLMVADRLEETGSAMPIAGYGPDMAGLQEWRARLEREALGGFRRFRGTWA